MEKFILVLLVIEMKVTDVNMVLWILDDLIVK